MNNVKKLEELRKYLLEEGVQAFEPVNGDRGEMVKSDMDKPLTVPYLRLKGGRFGKVTLLRGSGLIAYEYVHQTKKGKWKESDTSGMAPISMFEKIE